MRKLLEDQAESQGVSDLAMLLHWLLSKASELNLGSLSLAVHTLIIQVWAQAGVCWILLLPSPKEVPSRHQ